LNLLEFRLGSEDQLLDGNNGTVYVYFKNHLLLVYVSEGLYSCNLLEGELSLFQLANDLLNKAVASSFRESLEFVDDGGKYFSQLTSFNGDGLSYKFVAGKNVMEESGKFDGGSFDFNSQLVYSVTGLAHVSDGVNADEEVLYGSIVFDESALDDGVGMTMVLLYGRLNESQFLDLSISVLYLSDKLSSKIGNGSGSPGSSDLLEGYYILSQVLYNLLDGASVEFAAVANFAFEPIDDVVDVAGISEGLDGKSLFDGLAAGTDKVEGFGEVVGDGLDLGGKLLSSLTIISHVAGLLHLDEDVTESSQNLIEYTVKNTTLVEAYLGRFLNFVLSNVSQFVEFGDDTLNVQVKLAAQFDGGVRFESVNLLKSQRDFVHFSGNFLKNDVVFCVVLDFSLQHLVNVFDGLSKFSNLDNQHLSVLLAVGLYVLEISVQTLSNELDLSSQSPGVLSVENDLKVVLHLHLEVMKTGKEVDEYALDKSVYTTLDLLYFIRGNKHKFLDFYSGVLDASSKIDSELVRADSFNVSDALVERHLDLVQVVSNLLEDHVSLSITSGDFSVQFADDDFNKLRESACLVDEGSVSDLAVGNNMEHSRETVGSDLDLESQFLGSLTDLNNLVDTLELELYVLKDVQVLDKYGTYYNIEVTLGVFSIVLGYVGEFPHFRSYILEDDMELRGHFVGRVGGFVDGYLLKGGDVLSQMGNDLLENGVFASVGAFNFEPLDDGFDVVGQSAGLEFNLFGVFTVEGSALEEDGQVVGVSLDLHSQLLGTLAVLAELVHSLELNLLVLKSSYEIVEDAVDGSAMEFTLSLLVRVLSNPGQFLDFSGGFLDVGDKVHLKFLSGSNIFKISNLLKRSNDVFQVSSNLLRYDSAIGGAVAYGLDPFDDGLDVLSKFVALFGKNLSGLFVVDGERFKSSG